MAASFFYNGTNIFEGLAYTPLVERDVDSIYVNGRKAIVDRVILKGRLVEACKISGIWIWVDENEDPIITEVGDIIIYESGNNLLSNSILVSQEIANRFRENFKQFQIREGATVLFNANQAIVRSINFEEGKWTGLTPYEIVIECYRQDYAETWGILDPSAEFSYQQNGNKTVNYTATISARGINTSNKAIQNAINFVNNYSYLLTPEFASAAPEFTNYAGVFAFRRQNQTNIDRLSGVVTRTESYIYNEDGMNALEFQNGVLEFQTDLSKDEQGVVDISIQGSLTGDLSANIELMIGDIKNYDWYSIANNLYKRESSENLPLSPQQFSSEVNYSEKIVTFNITYSNRKEDNVYIIDSTSVSRNFEENTTCITVNITFRKDFGCSKIRWQDLQNYYKNFNLKQYIQQKWNKYVDNTTIKNNFTNESYSENEFSGEIQVSATYCNNNSESCECLSSFDYNMNYELPINRYIQKDTYGGEGCYYVENLKSFPRTRFQIQGNVTPSFCCSFEETVSEIKSKINILVNKYFPGKDKILESAEITEDKNNRNISFSTSLNAEQEEYNAIVKFPKINGITPGDGRLAYFSAFNGVMKNLDNTVYQWNDLSGNGFHATQTTSTDRPIFNPIIANGRPALVFDGINDMLNLTGEGLNLMRNRDYGYLVAVFKHENLNDGVTAGAVSFTRGTSNTERFSIKKDSSNLYATSVRPIDLSILETFYKNPVQNGITMLISEAEFSNGVVSLFLDRETKDSSLFSGGVTSNTASINVNIGGINNSFPWRGIICAVAIIAPPNPLSDKEIIEIKQWAASHYGGGLI